MTFLKSVFSLFVLKPEIWTASLNFLMVLSIQLYNSVFLECMVDNLSSSLLKCLKRQMPDAP